MAEPLVNQLNVSGEGKALVLGGPNYGTINLGEVRKLVRRFVDVPPLPPHPIVGREGVVAELRARLCGAGGIAAVSALDGLPGVGKTTVAVGWRGTARCSSTSAGACSGRCRSAGQRRRRAQPLGGGAGRGAGPGGRRERAGEAVSRRLQEKAEGAPVLLVVDDVWTWEQVRPFKEIAFPGCAHLVTTRDAELARRFAGDEIRVETLPDGEAEDFVARGAPGRGRRTRKRFARWCGPWAGALGLALIAEELGRHEGQASWVRKAMERLGAVEARLALEAAEGGRGSKGCRARCERSWR